MKITIKRGSVVYADCDCIVNAANQGLIQGGGVCGAIFYQARGRLTEECNAIGYCPTGHAVMTNGYELNAVISFMRLGLFIALMMMRRL